MVRRTDALGFLAAVVEAAPAAVAGGFMQPALDHFEHLLSSGQRGQSIRARSLSALFKVRYHPILYFYYDAPGQ